MLIGIEIELEGDSLHDHIFTYWCKVDEGSLRGGRELVSSVPYNDSEIVHSLAEIDRLIQDRPHITVGERCSLHVHLDMRKVAAKRRVIGILNYLLVERELYRISGNRLDSEFCLPLANNSQFKKGLSKCIPYPGRKVIPTTSKYQGLNTAPLLTQGSIEIRIHEGCLDTHRIYQWVQLLKRLWGKELIGNRTTREYLVYLANHSVQVANSILLDSGSAHPLLNVDVISEVLYLSRVKGLNTYA